jgi:hypothetical protein
MGKADKSTDENVSLSRERLLKGLRGLIKQIDVEGFLFLIKQSNVLIYNQNVETLNKK